MLLRALHAARPVAAKLLLDLGANALAKDDDGKDCQELAANIKHDEARTELAARCKAAKDEYGCFRLTGQDGQERVLEFEEDLTAHSSMTSAVSRA